MHRQPPSPPSSDDEPQPLTPPSVSTDSVFPRMQSLPSPKEVGLGVMGINWDSDASSSSSSPLLDAEIRPSPRRQVSFTQGTTDRPKSHYVAPEMGEPVTLAASLSRSATTMSRQASSVKEKKIKRKAVPSLPLDDMLGTPHTSGSTLSHSTSIVPPVPSFPDMSELSKMAGGPTMHPSFSTVSLRPMHTLEVAPPLPRTPTTPRPDNILPSPPRPSQAAFVKSMISSPTPKALDDSSVSPPLERKKTLRSFYANARGAKSVADISSKKISPPLPSQIVIPARRSSHIVVHSPTPVLAQPTQSPTLVPPRHSSLEYHGVSHWSDTSDSGRSSGDGASLSGGSLSETESELRTPAATIGKTSFIEEMDRGTVRIREKGSSLSSGSVPTSLVEKIRAEEGGRKSGSFLGRSASLMKAKKGLSKLLHRSSAQ